MYGIFLPYLVIKIKISTFNFYLLNTGFTHVHLQCIKKAVTESKCISSVHMYESSYINSDAQF